MVGCGDRPARPTRVPLSGGPSALSAESLAVGEQLHRNLARMLERGIREGSIRDDVTIRDLILFGAMLVTPLPGAADWTGTARRQKEISISTALSQTHWRD